MNKGGILMDNRGIIRAMVKKSSEAQKEFERCSQEQVDAVVKEIAKTVFDKAEVLARMAVDETRMGVYKDKVMKNQGKAMIIWNSLMGRRSVGIIDRDKDKGLVMIAKPKGVIAAVTPCTNPIVTPMCNAMFALKGRNSVIVAPHPRSKKCSAYTIDLVNTALRKFDTPEDLIQVIREPSIELTNELMKTADVVVATGGMGMVKAAYSSGRPAYGVGQGNVQCIIDVDADLKEAVPKIILGRTFDNGIICSGEQTVMIHEDRYVQTIQEFINNGAYYTEDEAEKDRLRKALFPDGVMNKDLVGQSIQTVAGAAGITIPEGTKLIIVKADAAGNAEIFCKEKMCPVITSFKYSTFEEAVDMAAANLEFEGKGHSVSIHSKNMEKIEYAGRHLNVSRIVVDQPAAVTLGGSFNNGFAATTTLGCGSWGNNSISENLDFTHLINISRIGYFMEDAHIPSDKELWDL
jgi:succinate-semialdehyde dehydrogenase